MRWAELTLPVGLAVFAASLTVGSLDLKYADQYSFGPGFVPLNAGIILFVCCAIQIWRSWRKREVGKDVPVEGAERAGPDFRGVVLTVLLIVAGIAAMGLGSVLAPILVMVILMSWWISKHSLALSVFVGLATTATIYLVFSVWLGLPVA